MKWPEGWREVALLEVCDLNPKLVAGERPSGETPVSFVPMAAVDEAVGAITAAETRTFAEVQKGYTPFRDGDVLFAKVTPCMENGKAAIAHGLLNGLGFGSTEFHVLRPNPQLLLAEYLFHFIRQSWFRDHAASAFVGTGGLQRVPPDFFKRVKLPLPPFAEQQRIVEVLLEANYYSAQFVARREKLGSIIERSLQSVVESCREQEWHPLGSMIDTKYGTSVRADAEASAGVPVLRIPNVLGGEISLADLKYASLPDAERERLTLVSGDVLIVRSNGNPDYVGRCAPVDEVIADTGCVYASYLIRLRPNSKRLRGFYLAALLNSQVGRNAMRNAIRTTAGQSNLSAESLASVRLPVPSTDDQLQFENVWKGVQSLRRQLETSEKTCQKLVDAILAEALSGRLTATWREQHRAELESAIRERDAALGTSKPRMEIRITEHAEPERDTGFDRPRRQALIDQLSTFQHEVWNALRYEWRGAVLTDDRTVFEDFCTGTAAWRLEGFQPAREEVRRALEQLAALGLIRKMSLPRDNPTTRRTEYLTAFRPLRKDPQGSRAEEDSALADTARVAGELKRRVRERR